MEKLSKEELKSLLRETSTTFKQHRKYLMAVIVGAITLLIALSMYTGVGEWRMKKKEDAYQKKIEMKDSIIKMARMKQLKLESEVEILKDRMSRRDSLLELGKKETEKLKSEEDEIYKHTRSLNSTELKDAWSEWERND